MLRFIFALTAIVLIDLGSPTPVAAQGCIPASGPNGEAACRLPRDSGGRIAENWQQWCASIGGTPHQDPMWCEAARRSTAGSTGLSDLGIVAGFGASGLAVGALAAMANESSKDPAQQQKDAESGKASEDMVKAGMFGAGVGITFGLGIVGLKHVVGFTAWQKKRPQDSFWRNVDLTSTTTVHGVTRIGVLVR